MEKVESLPGLIARWSELQEQRKELERLAGELKSGPEADAAKAITAWLAANNVKHAACAGIGTAAIRRDLRIDVADGAKVSEFILGRMTELARRGAPLAEGLCLQQRAHRGNLLDYAKERLMAQGYAEADTEHPALINTILAPCGFSATVVESLHFTKERSR
jgi:hypothetical protein